MSQIKAIKGFADLDAAESRQFYKMEQAAREIFTRYGYQEMRTPVMEFTELFKRGIGTETDVVQKEMFTLEDSKGRSMTLRPEATAGVLRAYIEHNVSSREAISKFYTYGPMFRHERPQKGRMRQFHQVNCECLGPSQPESDAELICMLMEFLQTIGIQNLTLQLNSLGCKECRPTYRTVLREWLAGLDKEALCEDCKRRMDTNPLRTLDCKVPACKEHTAAAPLMLEHNCPACAEHFAVVTRLLNAQGIKYELNHRLVRGLDYYNRTTFEVVSNSIGSQGSVAGGGRYDGLVSSLDGPDVPGLGFACGMERLAMLMPREGEPRPDFYLAVLTVDARDAAFALAQNLRQAGLGGAQSFEARSMKSAMRQADKSLARNTLILGQDELVAGTVVIKNMDGGGQLVLPINKAAEELSARKVK